MAATASSTKTGDWKISAKPFCELHKTEFFLVDCLYCRLEKEAGSLPGTIPPKGSVFAGCEAGCNNCERSVSECRESPCPWNADRIGIPDMFDHR